MRNHEAPKPLCCRPCHHLNDECLLCYDSDGNYKPERYNKIKEEIVSCEQKFYHEIQMEESK